MSQNALLRSGKGLGIPGTARKEDRKTKLKLAAPAPTEDRQEDARQKTPPRPFRGSQWGALRRRASDRRSARAERLDDIEHIEATLRRCVEAARATLLHIHLHHFQPNGVSGVAVLAESHISIHTWPEAGYAALDVFMCGSADPDAVHPGAARGVFRKARRRERNLARPRRLSGLSIERLLGAAGPGPGRFLIRGRRGSDDKPGNVMAEKRWIAETLFDDLGFRMSYQVDKVLYEMQTEHQHLVLFEHRSSARC